MIEGFLPFSRATIMMDVVAVAMVFLVPTLTLSLYRVRKQQRYGAHKRLQIGTGTALLITVLLFEVDVRINGWQHLAEPSPFYETWLFPLLYVHLFFAVSTTLLWIAAMTHALRAIPSPPRPSSASPRHRMLGRLAALGLYCTSITGWTFFWAAFIA